MITIKVDGLQDGLYNIKNGKIFKYRAKGGTVRTYEMGEVVRCRDCKHVQTTKCPFFQAKWGYTDDDYCSCGERREDGEA